MTSGKDQSTFPKWTNSLPLVVLSGLTILLAFIVFVFWYWFSPKNLNVGYRPSQPIEYSHRLHAGELGIDCRYCHQSVEIAAHAGIPSTETCMNCHKIVKTDSPEIQKIHESYNSGEPIEWVRVHRLPDYSYFDHSAHVSAGVSCVSCHGRVDQMEIVSQVEPLSMGWCLECHREPEPHLRPVEFVTKLDWSTEDPVALGKALREAHNINPREDCSTCHR